MFLTLALVSLLTTADSQTPPPQQPPVVRPPATTGAPQTPAGQTPAAPGTAATPAVQGPYEFTSELGAFLIVVKADKVTAFEAAMTKLKAAFALATTPTPRKQQASGWRVFKSTEVATGATVATPTEPAVAGTVSYLFLIDPVSKKTSYDPIEIMRELAPGEMQSVYDSLKDSWVSATRIGLKELLRMGGGG